jgi:hypothetical protein
MVVLKGTYMSMSTWDEVLNWMKMTHPVVILDVFVGEEGAAVTGCLEGIRGLECEEEDE